MTPAKRPSRWRTFGRIAKMALKVAAPFIPGGAIVTGVVSAINTVEDVAPALNGADKKAKVLAAVQVGVAGVEIAKGDVFNDAAVQAALSGYIDAIVAGRNVGKGTIQVIRDTGTLKAALLEAMAATRQMRS